MKIQNLKIGQKFQLVYPRIPGARKTHTYRRITLYGSLIHRTYSIHSRAMRIIALEDENNVVYLQWGAKVKVI